jgi:DNA-binding winged helix-turn-helix (wHTH) protein
MDDSSVGRVRFGNFELDRRSGELLKGGSRLRLQEAPLRVLEALIDRRGEIVRREELKRKLWPADTFVDFDNGLNTAVNRLRSSLGDNAERPKFIETVGRRGYRFIARLDVETALLRATAVSTSGIEARLAVLPFRALKSDPDTDFLAFGLADAVASSLSGLESLSIRSPIACARYGADSPDVAAMAAALDITLLLAGSILRVEDRVRVSTQLVEVPSGTLLWTTTSDAALADLFKVTETLVRRIVESLRVPLTVRDTRQLDRDVSGSGEAFQVYLRANGLGRYPKTWPQARDLYLESVRLDPHYAPAWARLGCVYRMMAKYAATHDPQMQQRAEESFRRALAINPELSLAHHLYAQREMETGRTLEAFVRLLDRARERRADPQLFVALVQASRYVGLLDASRAAHERAKTLDPMVKTSVAYTSLFSGDYAKAAAEAHENDDPLEGFLFAMMGRTAEASEAFKSLRQAYGDNETWTIYIDIATAFLGGDRDALIAQTDVALSTPFADPEGVFQICLLLAMSREPSRALIALKRPSMRGSPVWPHSRAIRPCTRFGDSPNSSPYAKPSSVSISKPSRPSRTQAASHCSPDAP